MLGHPEKAVANRRTGREHGLDAAAARCFGGCVCRHRDTLAGPWDPLHLSGLIAFPRLTAVGADSNPGSAQQLHSTFAFGSAVLADRRARTGYTLATLE